MALFTETGRSIGKEPWAAVLSAEIGLLVQRGHKLLHIVTTGIKSKQVNIIKNISKISVLEFLLEEISSITSETCDGICALNAT